MDNYDTEVHLCREILALPTKITIGHVRTYIANNSPKDINTIGELRNYINKAIEILIKENE